MDKAPDDPKLKQLDAQFRQATAHRQGGDAELAEALLKKLLMEYESGGYHERQVMVRINLAQILHQQGKLEEAIEEYQKAAAQADALGDRRRRALVLGGLSVISAERGDREEAERLIGESLSIFMDVGDPVGVANQLGNLGLLRQSEGNLGEALECFSQAAALFAQTGNAPGAIGVLQCVGELHRRQGEYAEAMVSHQQALLLSQQVGDLVHQAHSLRAIGQLERIKGNLETAAKFIEKGMSLHQRTGDVLGVLSALIDLGTVEFALGRLSQAIHRLDQCIGEARRLRLVNPLAKGLLNRAIYRLDTDLVDQVRADLDEAKELVARLNDPALSNIFAVASARILMRQSRWQEAQKLLGEELERATRANLAGFRPAILGMIASLDTVLGKTRQGIEGFRESESLYRALGDVDGMRMALLAHAQNVAETGAHQEGLTALDSLWRMVEGPGGVQPVLQAEILLGRAAVHHLRQAYGAALQDLAGAIERYQQAQFQLSEIGARVFQAKVIMDAHRVEGTSLPEDLVGQLAPLVERAEAFECPTVSIIAHVTLAEALFLADLRDQAREEALRCLQRSEQHEFLTGVGRSLELLARIDQDAETARKAHDLWLSMDCVVRAALLRQEWGLVQPDAVEKP